MRIRNDTGLTVVPVAGRIDHPAHSMTVVAKALLRLEPDQLTELVDDEEFAFPTGDLPAGEDDEVGEIRHASDFVPYKPRTDFILVGSCHPPDGDPVRSCRVTFQVGQHGRSLQVFGDRWWAGSTVGHQMTEPEPFTRMPLTWERAYGGPDCPDNPVGRGSTPIELEDGRRAWPLPNVEDPERRVSTPDDRPIPAGFGPIPVTWEPRRSLAGSYDDQWLRSRWPWYPADMDWGLFNAATPSLQLEGFLQGDELVFLENLHPADPDFRTRLPGFRVRCFVNELPDGFDAPPDTEKERQDWSPPPRDELRFREIPVQLDTIWVDADDGLVALVWRGYGPARDEEFSGVLDLFLMTEPLEKSPAELEECRAAFWRQVDLEDDPDVDEPLGAAPGEGEPAREDEEAEDEDPEDEIELDLDHDPEAQLRKDLERMGIDPDNPPEPTEEDIERSKEFFRERGMDEIVALLEEEEPEPAADEEDAPPPTWTRERVEARYAEDGDFADCDLRGLDLSELTLEGANFSGCDLTGVDLTRAILTDADLTGSELEGAKLQEAELAGAIFESAGLRSANLTGAKAPEAIFVEADLSDATLVDADFSGAEFTGAVLDRVDARRASFESAEFDRVHAVEAMFANANFRELRAADALDLSESNFTQIEAAGSVWSGATLMGCILAWAVLDGANFTGANLAGADLYAARLREARFAKANLLDARLATADAFEASFEKADLARADLRGGNFYAAEFLEARFWETLTEGANLGMTKYG